ncbi:MAG: hypothetical protein DWQ07_09525 [Chloroflexi bacterium]|nr:MAG: hypothetical protein DWQ07_09525 [Chloroflexota bacterium]MBL1193047.1 hypothetical protein [Chloroflexota bacterium]NOH10340.1 AAA family ATPase [Chloroflexota bacterium]
MTFHTEMLSSLPFVPTPDQKAAIQRLYAFFEGDANICILRGFAGTGKCSLTTSLVSSLDKAGISYKLLSPTNRSARQLADSTKRPVLPLRDQLYTIKPGQTSELFTQMNAQHPEEESILIVDQASMLSANPTEADAEVVQPRGMLTDLLTFIQREPSARLLLLVDPTEHPYFEDDNSLPLSALSFSYVYKGSIEEIDLGHIASEVLTSSSILNTTYLHASVKRESFAGKRAILDLNEPDLQRIRAKDLPGAYQIAIQRNGKQAVQIICRTHAKAHEYNQFIHKEVLGFDAPLAVGDRVVVTKPYTDTALLKEKITYLSDGEIAIIHAVGPQERIGEFAFQHVVISVEVEGGRLASVPAMVKLNTLISERPRFTFQERAELIDLRKKEYQEIDSKVLYETLLADPYINALEIEYSYAMTWQRALGSAWDHVIIDSENALEELPPEQAYRWMYSALKCSREAVTFVDLPDSHVHGDLPEILAEVVYLPAEEGAQVQEISPNPAGEASEVIEEVLPDWLASYQIDTQQRRAERVKQEEGEKEEEIPDWLANPDGKAPEEQPPVVEEVDEIPEEPIEDPDLADLVEDVRSQLLEEEPEPEPDPVIEAPPEKKAEEPDIVLDKPLELEDIFVPEPAPAPAPFLAPEPAPEPPAEVVSNESDEPYFDWPEPLEEQEPYVPPWQRGAPKSEPSEYKTEAEEEEAKEPAAWEILPTKKPEAEDKKGSGGTRWMRWLLVSLLIMLAVAVVIFTGGQPIDTTAVAAATETATDIPASPTPTVAEEAPTPVPVSVVNGCATIGGLRIRQEPSEEAGIAGGMNFEQCLPFDAISEDGAWLRTQEGNEEGVVGWVALDFLIVDGNVQDLPVVE